MSVKQKTAALLVCAGAALLFGAITPWAQVVTILGTLSIAGTVGDGKITLVMGLIVAGIGVWYWVSEPPRRWHVVALLAATAALAVAVYDAANISHTVANSTSRYVVGSVGFGLWLTLVGGIAGVVGSLALLRTETEANPPKVAPWLWRSRGGPRSGPPGQDDEITPANQAFEQ